MSDYGVKDIKTLEGIEAIRLRPGMYYFPFKNKERGKYGTFQSKR